ncbi:MAG: hypothetical protein RJA70_575 [Pseudomonadota bacterium]|jgi:uncharacterized protein (TIGR02265 family)
MYSFQSRATAAVLPPAFKEDELDERLSQKGVFRSDFLTPDLSAEVDVQARILATPTDAIVKGMFFEYLARSARRFNVPCAPSYTAFRDYPMRDYMDLLYRYGRSRYPRLPVREAIRRVGWEAFPSLMESIAGRVIFAIAGRDIQAALKVTPKAYAHSIRPGQVEVAYLGEHQCVLELRNVWNFPDFYQVGTLEGGCRTFQPGVQAWTRVHSLCNVDILLRW